MRRLLPTGRLVLLALLALAAPAWARMDDATFRRTAREVRRVMDEAGKLPEKLELLRVLGSEDSRRITELVFRWYRASRALVDEDLGPQAAKLKEAYDEDLARLEKKRAASRRGPSAAQERRLAKRRERWQAAQKERAVEDRVQRDLARLLAAAQDADALGWVAREGVPALLDARLDGPLLAAAFDHLLAAPPDQVQVVVLAVLQRPLVPAAAIRGLDWVARHKPEQAARRLGPLLTAPSPAVRRAAIAALEALDDRRCVPLLIESLKALSGLEAAQTETLLQRFTGKTFSADHTAWKRWWTAEGQAWLDALEAAKRFDPLTMSGGVSFYGIRSPSKRVAFVLDRSGSMKAPAVHHAPASPVTGGDKESWAGKTRLEVAKIQLGRTIDNLASDVLFTLVFYDYLVEVWKEPPTLLAATRKHKDEARAWFMKLEPGSSTSLFEGLLKALEYAETLADPADGPRIDTIFLLSDGAPSHFRGQELKTDEDVDAAYEVFKQANGPRRIVVHAIGVGQGHNEKLMRRIAADSGGKYIAVGMD